MADWDDGVPLEVEQRMHDLRPDVQELKRLRSEIARLKADETQGGKDYCALQDRSDEWQVRALNAELELAALRAENERLKRELLALRAAAERAINPNNQYDYQRPALNAGLRAALNRSKT